MSPQTANSNGSDNEFRSLIRDMAAMGATQTALLSTFDRHEKMVVAAVSRIESRFDATDAKIEKAIAASKAEAAEHRAATKNEVDELRKQIVEHGKSNARAALVGDVAKVMLPMSLTGLAAAIAYMATHR